MKENWVPQRWPLGKVTSKISCHMLLKPIEILYGSTDLRSYFNKLLLGDPTWHVLFLLKLPLRWVQDWPDKLGDETSSKRSEAIGAEWPTLNCWTVNFLLNLHKSGFNTCGSNEGQIFMNVGGVNPSLAHAENLKSYSCHISFVLDSFVGANQWARADFDNLSLKLPYPRVNVAAPNFLS